MPSMSSNVVSALCAGCLLGVAPAHALGAETAATEGLVAFVQEQQLAATATPLAWGLEAQVLRDDARTGAAALKLRLPAGWRQAIQSSSAAMEIFVLEGGLRFGEALLAEGDWVRVPAGSPIGPIQTETSAELLMFHDGEPRFRPVSGSAEPSGWEISLDRDTPWVAAEVARKAGVPLDMGIKHFRNDSETGARTFLVSLPPGTDVPWESHPTSEEGYLLKGDHTLEECLPDGVRSGTYRPGGYFYRPAGIMHMGPGTYTKTGAVWLIRTEALLEDTFHATCPVAEASASGAAPE